MSLENMKVTDFDKENYGIISASDILDGNSTENKQKFDRLPNFIADKHNEVIDYVNENIYSKMQTDTAINEKVLEISSADMTKAVFAKNEKQSQGYVDKSIISDNGINTYTQLLDILTGEGENGKFRATDSNTYSTFNILGVNYNVQLGEISEISLVNKRWYSFIIDEVNKTINFNSGGTGIAITVVGGLERPESPKNNTIWIKETFPDNKKINYKIGYTLPDVKEDNDVYFIIDEKKSVFVYADTKNTLEVSIKECNIWKNDSWQKTSFEAYVKDKWIGELFTGNYILYNKILYWDKWIDVSHSSSTTVFNEENGVFYMTSTGSASNVIFEKVDLTNKSTITAGMSATRNQHFLRVLNKDDNTIVVDSKVVYSTSPTIDVSQLSGEYRVSVIVVSEANAANYTTNFYELILND